MYHQPMLLSTAVRFNAHRASWQVAAGFLLKIYGSVTFKTQLGQSPLHRTIFFHTGNSLGPAGTETAFKHPSKNAKTTAVAVLSALLAASKCMSQ